MRAASLAQPVGADPLAARELAMDFQFDETRDDKKLKMLNIQDIYTREFLAVSTARSITADDVTTLLDELVAEHGGPDSHCQLAH